MIHRHHIIPKHAGGTDAPSNIVELTLEEHADAHNLLYYKYGKWEDRIAELGLLGWLAKEDIIKETISHKGERNPMYGVRKYGSDNPNYGNDKIAGKNNFFYGKKHSDEVKEMCRQGALNQPLKTCEHCGKTLRSAHYGRYHGSKCKHGGQSDG